MAGQGKDQSNRVTPGVSLSNASLLVDDGDVARQPLCIRVVRFLNREPIFLSSSISLVWGWSQPKLPVVLRCRPSSAVAAAPC